MLQRLQSCLFATFVLVSDGQKTSIKVLFASEVANHGWSVVSVKLLLKFDYEQNLGAVLCQPHHLTSKRRDEHTAFCSELEFSLAHGTTRQADYGPSGRKCQ